MTITWELIHSNNKLSTSSLSKKTQPARRTSQRTPNNKPDARCVMKNHPLFELERTSKTSSIWMPLWCPRVLPVTPPASTTMKTAFTNLLHTNRLPTTTASTNIIRAGMANRRALWCRVWWRARRLSKRINHDTKMNLDAQLTLSRVRRGTITINRLLTCQTTMIA